MAESATIAAEDAAGGSGRKFGRRSDGGSAIVGYLGDFTRGHVVFTVYRIGPDQSRYPNGPSEYLVDCDDGVGPHEVCRFTEEDSEVERAERERAVGQRSEGQDAEVHCAEGRRSEGQRLEGQGAQARSVDGGGFDVVWRGAWNGDEWCDWIMERARAFVAEPCVG